jgi:putative copper resistance protein D
MLSLPLIAARVVHFASTVMVAGTVLFMVLAAPSDLRGHRDRIGPVIASLRDRLMVIAGVSLAISILSGTAWLLFLVAKISGSSLTWAISTGAATTFLARTQFGHDWDARLVLAVLLAIALVRLRRNAGWRSVEGFIAAALAMGFLGALAWSGHGGATPGLRGGIHVTGDVLHLAAAGAWIGGVLPLGVLLSSAERMSAQAGISVAHDAASRFSTLGLIAVAVLIVTGLVNTWVLVGSVGALFEFQYGRLLLLKLALFLVMVAVAAVNRIQLTPRLTAAAESGSHAGLYALRRLKLNCFVETALGLAILIVVGVLGSMSPGMDMPEE